MYEKSETAPRRDRIKRLLRIAAALVGLGLLIRLNPFIDLIGLADVWMNRYEGLSAWGFGWRAAVEMFAVGAALLILSAPLRARVDASESARSASCPALFWTWQKSFVSRIEPPLCQKRFDRPHRCARFVRGGASSRSDVCFKPL